MTTARGTPSPRVVVIAGPNGSGKSTFAVQRRNDDPAFPLILVNPDEIEQSLEISDPQERQQAAFWEGRARRKQLITERADFALETVCSHPSTILELEEARRTGYQVIVYYLSTRDARINLRRVRRRAKQEGGHDVEPDKIRNRHVRCHQLFPRLIETADLAFVFDASTLPIKPVFAFIHGTIHPDKHLTRWARECLLPLFQERSEERARAETDAAAAGARLALPNEMSGTFTGPFRAVYRHYILQCQAGSASPEIWIRHDRALLEGGTRELKESEEVTLQYHSGWARLIR
jgi:predicted ABC-type ATPase